MSHPTYRIQTVTDMLKVPADRRSAMLRDLETALLTHELAFGDEAQSVAINMTWTDDDDRSVDISANGKPLLSLKVTKNSAASDLQSVECPPDPRWVDEQLASEGGAP